MSIKVKSDPSSAFSGLDKLKGPARTQLARSMAVAAGKVYRDEAKLRAPIGNESAGEGISPYPGALKESIYLAYQDEVSNDSRVVYSISWNKKIAPHGYWIEFGHWRRNELIQIGTSGLWVATKTKIDPPVWVPAQPFMRPTLDAARTRANEAAVARGRVRLSELLSGKENSDV